MKTQHVYVADDKKAGMTAKELRQALHSAPERATVRVVPGFGGQIQKLVVTSE